MNFLLNYEKYFLLSCEIVKTPVHFLSYYLGISSVFTRACFSLLL